MNFKSSHNQSVFIYKYFPIFCSSLCSKITQLKRYFKEFLFFPILDIYFLLPASYWYGTKCDTWQFPMLSFTSACCLNTFSIHFFFLISFCNWLKRLHYQVCSSLIIDYLSFNYCAKKKKKEQIPSLLKVSQPLLEPTSLSHLLPRAFMLSNLVKKTS